jgi:hypothetical protein
MQRAQVIVREVEPELIVQEAGADVSSLWELLELNPFAVQFRYEILDDEPMDHKTILTQVAALVSLVERLVNQGER